MKGLASASLFRAFELYVRPKDFAALDTGWSQDGVDWRRIRHAYKGSDYGYSIDVFKGVKAGRRGWAMMIVRESWSVGLKDDAARSTQWAHMIAGNRADALAWFKAQEAIPDHLSVGHQPR